MFAAERGQVGRAGSVFQIKGWGLREWFVLTYIMGAVFIAGQATEYASLVHEGITIPSSATARCSTSPPASTGST